MLAVAAVVVSAARAADPVPLGTAANFAILAKSGISTAPPSMIKGNIGVSPIAFTAMTGFSLTADPSNAFSTSTQVKGRAYAANYAAPTPSHMTTAVSDMETAYTDAAGRATTRGSNLNVMAGLISGATFKPGVYTWGSDVMFGSDIYIKGSSADIFIFQATGNVIVGSGARVVLVDGGGGGGKPQASNIVWQMAGYLDAGTTSHLEGVFLVKTHAVFKTGSSMTGRVLAQTACTLDSATIAAPSLQASPVAGDEDTTDPGDGVGSKDPPAEDEDPQDPPAEDEDPQDPPAEDPQDHGDDENEDEAAMKRYIHRYGHRYWNSRIPHEDNGGGV